MLLGIILAVLILSLAAYSLFTHHPYRDEWYRGLDHRIAIIAAWFWRSALVALAFYCAAYLAVRAPW